MDEAKAKRSDLTCLLWVLGVFATLGVGLLVTLFAVAYENNKTFACRSKQSEAKTNLMGLFTAEKAFFSEYDSYSTDLVSVAWAPDGTPRYLFGFAAPSTDYEAELRVGNLSYDPNRATTDHPMGVGATPRYSVAKMAGLNRSLLPAHALVTQKSFTAAAIGDLDGDPTLDVWTIDDAKQLTNLVNDCLQ